MSVWVKRATVDVSHLGNVLVSGTDHEWFVDMKVKLGAWWMWCAATCNVVPGWAQMWPCWFNTCFLPLVSKVEVQTPAWCCSWMAFIYHPMGSKFWSLCSKCVKLPMVTSWGDVVVSHGLVCVVYAHELYTEQLNRREQEKKRTRGWFVAFCSCFFFSFFFFLFLVYWWYCHP